MNGIGLGIEVADHYFCVLVRKGDKYGVVLNGKVRYFSNSALQVEEAKITAQIYKSGNKAALAAHKTLWEDYS